MHKYPEESLKEYNTAKKIEEELDKLNIPHKRIGETGILGVIQGAKIFIKEGALDGVEEILGAHVSSGIDVGKVSVTSGPIGASCDYFKIKVTGRGGHVSTPHLSIDALYIASEIVINLQSIVSRQTDPVDTVVVGVGVISGGTIYNAVAEEVLVEFKDYASPLINDEKVSEEVASIASNIIGEENVITNHPKKLGADDFAEYLIEVPGTYFHVGTRNLNNINTSVEHHNHLFDIDEEGLLITTNIEVDYVLKKLL